MTSPEAKPCASLDCRVCGRRRTIHFDHIHGDVQMLCFSCGDHQWIRLRAGRLTTPRLGRLQGWLHARGHLSAWLGNRLADLRFIAWKAANR